MKIVIVTSPFGCLPPLATGAVEKLFHQLATVWAAKGNDVCFVCAGGGEESQIAYRRIGKFNRTGRTLTDLPIDFIYSLKALWVMPKCDVLVCNTFWSPFLAPIFRWKYQKLIYGVHRYPKHQFWLYPFVRAHICVSTMIGNALRAQHRYLSNKIVVICNPVDTKVFTPSLRRDNSAFRVVYTGRVSEEKGLVKLAKAIRSLVARNEVISKRGLRLILVGPWETAAGGSGVEYVNQIRKEVPNVELIGPIRDPYKLATFIKAADVYCYPTIAERGEAMPVAPLEAMACGAPVIIPRFGCFADYAKDGVNCLMYDNQEGLAAALETVLLNKSLRESLGSATHHRAQDFAIDNVADRYLKAFEL